MENQLIKDTPVIDYMKDNIHTYAHSLTFFIYIYNWQTVDQVSNLPTPVRLMIFGLFMLSRCDRDCMYDSFCCASFCVYFVVHLGSQGMVNVREAIARLVTS